MPLAYALFITWQVSYAFLLTHWVELTTGNQRNAFLVCFKVCLGNSIPPVYSDFLLLGPQLLGALTLGYLLVTLTITNFKAL